jgi:hypothetical protein
VRELETWHLGILKGRQRRLRTKGDPDEQELTLAKTKLGVLVMRIKLVEVLIENKGLMDEWKSSIR